MFQQLLEKIALGLEQRGLMYMVIGGQAVLLYGEPRLTKDIDITLAAGPERLSEILQMVHTWGWQVLVKSPVEFVREKMVLPCLDPASGIRIDFIFSFSPYERQAMERVRRVKIGAAQVCFASPEDLIIHKIVAGRPRDLEDARTILIKNPHLDKLYIREWLKQFEASLDIPFLKRWDELEK
ncbi:MAG: nucleotidyltransferase [Anaerolineae bacterium]|nr:nucleotidyltransferase [Anaerolineae bacterium]